MIVDVKEWKDICTRLFTTAGVSEEDSKAIAEAAVDADIRGVSSHGTARLLVYRERIIKKLINPTPDIKIVNDSPVLVHLDGDNGLGQVVAKRATEIAIERAQEYGCCCVSTFHSNHMALLSHFGLEIAKKGMIAYIMCNTPAFVGTEGAVEPVIGTNPVCWCLPGKEFPVVLDMAISPARGKIKNAAADGKPIPEGWALDKNGMPTTDAKAALEGVILPIAGHKGYGIGIIVEAFSALLSGGAQGRHMTHPLDDYDHIPNCGNFIMALDPSKILGDDSFAERVDAYMKDVKSCRKSASDANIIFPGEIEYRAELKTEEIGLEIPDDRYNAFIDCLGDR